MSGGVDSAVAAILLMAQGHEVIGVVMRLWHEGSQADDAQRIAEALGIPLHVLDYRVSFQKQVVEYFLAEYARGRTPNPCLACNRHIKFGLLLDRVLALGADYLATGHYARVRVVDGEYELRRGVDHRKDQSYFLYMLGEL